MHRRVSLVLFSCLVVLGFAGARGAERPPAPEATFRRAMEFGDRAWDESAGLLWSVAPGEDRRTHRVRESAWYACGLLVRGAPGDEARARRILDLVMGFQFDAPGQKWDGTYRRAPEEPAPGPGRDTLWKNFDPNWRLFIGTTFALVLEQHGERLPGELRARLIESIRRAVEGEIVQGREEPYHTNVSLMHGFLLGWAGARLQRPEWIAMGERWIEDARVAFAVHGSFEEYNSPTYYGVDLYGLALCRRYGATEKIRAAGAEMEAGLWREIARFYHPGLRNLCGPYDRAYGIDMRRYVSLTGLWMTLSLPELAPPFPDLVAGEFGHAHDLLAAPLYYALGAEISADTRATLARFSGDRSVARTIDGTRRATAWLSEDVMLGAESTGRTRDAGPGTSHPIFVAASGHWRVGADDVGWFALTQAPRLDAVASPGRIAMVGERGDFRFRVSAAGLSASQLTRDRWQLPGLAMTIETDADAVRVEPGDGWVEIVYRGASRLDLAVTTSP